MIPFSLKFFTADDGHQIFYNYTPVTKDIRQIMLVIHGMTEHGERYRDFAENLFRNNTAVYVIHLRGHGPTGRANGPMGHFADQDGWRKVMDDVYRLREIIEEECPNLPVFLFGHSMGSILARCCLIECGRLFSGGIICGTTVGVSSSAIALGKAIAEHEIAHFCPEHPSTLLQKITFGSFNRSFWPSRTKYDWLSSDYLAVDEYNADPNCGFVCSSAFYRDMFEGLTIANSTDNIDKMPADFPVLLISGDRDPVGNMGKDVRKIFLKMKKAGLQKVNMTLFSGMRHSILSDVHCEDVYGVVNGFIQHCSAEHIEG